MPLLTNVYFYSFFTFFFFFFPNFLFLSVFRLIYSLYIFASLFVSDYVYTYLLVYLLVTNACFPLQERLERLHNEFNGQVSSLQGELSEIKNIKEDLTRYIRELEQANDDLERAKR